MKYKIIAFGCLTLVLANNLSGSWSIKKMLPFMTSEEEIEFGTLHIDPDYAITIKALDGAVTLKPSQSNLVINVVKKGLEEELPSTVVTKRIDKGAKTVTLETVEKDPDSPIQLDYNISVPENLKKIIIQGRNCDVHTSGLDADYDVTTDNGKITLQQTRKNVKAVVSQQGSIEIEHEALPDTTSIFLQAMQGDVTVSLPKNVNAALKATTLKGEVTSNIPVTLESRTSVLTKESWKRLQREITGTLGNGGAPITIDVTKGDITINGY
jgi:hypothetical protein